MTAQTITRETPSGLRVVPSRARHRSPRDNFEPAMLALVVYVLTFAFLLVWPLVPGGFGQQLFGGLAVAGLVTAVYVAATVGTRR